MESAARRGGKSGGGRCAGAAEGRRELEDDGASAVRAFEWIRHGWR